MESPLVSVIVRTKDRAELLKDALRSIAGQTHSPVQVVLVNDGGCEVDLVEAESILGDIPVDYFRHDTSLGRGAALNQGLEHAKGDYVAFLDDDDIYYPSGIARLVTAAIKSGRQAVYGRVVCKTGNPVDVETDTTQRVLGEPFHFGKLLFENFIAINSLLVSRELVEITGPFDNDFEIFEDWDWIIRLAINSSPLFVDAVVGEYRMFLSCTLTGKGGAGLHRRCRERLLEKHLEKITGAYLLDYNQRVIDRIVLEKDAKNQHMLNKIVLEKDSKNQQLEMALDSLSEQHKGVEEQEKKRSEMIASLSQYIRKNEQTIHDLERSIHDLERIIHAHEQTIHGHERTIHDHEQTIHAHEQTIHDHERTIYRKEGQIDELGQALGHIRSSYFWRATKPVRLLETTAARLLRKNVNPQ